MAKHKYIDTPEKLWALFKDYVAHEAANPMYKRDYVGKFGEVAETPLTTPITFEGFECYLADKEIINDLGDYASNKNEAYPEYSTIITRIRKNCYVQNFKGAAVGLFSANLIARKLGLVEKAETKSETTLAGKVVIVETVSTGIPFASNEKDIDGNN